MAGNGFSGGPSRVTHDFCDFIQGNSNSQLWLVDFFDKMIFWMKNHLVSDSNYNIVNLLSPQKFTRKDK